MGRRAIWLLGGVLLAAAMPCSVLAASAVDQTSEAHVAYEWLGTGTVAQTFTVGVSGRLTGVDLFLWDTDGASVAVGIQALDRKTKLPDTGGALASGAQTVAEEKWYHFSLKPEVGCSAGAQLSIVLYGDSNSAAYRSSANTYSRGQALRLVGKWVPVPSTPVSVDLAFRTYMDDAPATPTPTAAATPTPKPAATPTPKPAATPTPKPAATPTPKPASTPAPDPTTTETPAPELPSAPAASAAAASESAPASDPAPTATVAASASADPKPGSSSSDPGGPPLPLVIAGIAGAGLLAGGLGFVFGRRRPKSA